MKTSSLLKVDMFANVEASTLFRSSYSLSCASSATCLDRVPSATSSSSSLSPPPPSSDSSLSRMEQLSLTLRWHLTWQV